MKNILKTLIVSLLILSCSNENKSNEINLYSQRHYTVDKKQYENFEKLTGIKINVIKANADELIERLKNEGENSPADLFVSVDAGKLQKGADLGLFQKINNSMIENNISENNQSIKNGIEITSPIIGTAYHAPEPGAKKFIEVGKKIKKGDTIMIVEAMKTMNHVPSSSDGIVKEICIDDGQPVEFGQTLIILE